VVIGPAWQLVSGTVCRFAMSEIGENSLLAPAREVYERAQVLVGALTTAPAIEAAVDGIKEEGVKLGEVYVQCLRPSSARTAPVGRGAREGRQASRLALGTDGSRGGDSPRNLEVLTAYKDPAFECD